jgi:hypothetical protein
MPVHRPLYAMLLTGGLALSVGSAAPGRAGEAVPAGGRTMHLKPLIVNDPFVSREAFRVLVPADWQASGQVVWRPHAQYPASGAFTAQAPDSAAAVWGYPMIPFVTGVFGFPEGSSYVGNEVRGAIPAVRGVTWSRSCCRDFGRNSRATRCSRWMSYPTGPMPRPV